MANTMTYSSKAALASRQILKDIQSGGYRHGAMFPKEDFLALRYNVSRPTIRKAVNILVQGGQLEKLPHRGVLLPTVTHSEEKSERISQIIFVTPASSGDTNEYTGGISSGIDSDKYALTVLSAHANLLELKKAYDQVLNLKPAGVIIHVGVPEKMCHIPGKQFAEAGIPVVAIGQHPVQELMCDRVVECPTLNVETVLDYALLKGYKDIAMFDPLPRTNEEAVDAVRRILKPRGLELSEEKIIDYDSPHGYGSVPNPYIDPELKMRELLNAGFKCDLLICGHDYPAVGALRAILAHGLKVPQDMAVVSQAANDIAGISPIPLTTINLHRKTLGRIAMKLLNRRMEGYDGPAEMHYVQPDIVQGKTA